MKVNVGFLISYDYELLKNSLPLVYHASYSIVLAIDKDRRTWAGNKINIPPVFFEWTKALDTENKIYEDEFYIKELNTIQNETREPNMLAKKKGEGVCLQIDADEYHVDFNGLVSSLHKKNLEQQFKYLFK